MLINPLPSISGGLLRLPKCHHRRTLCHATLTDSALGTKEHLQKATPLMNAVVCGWAWAPVSPREQKSGIGFQRTALKPDAKKILQV